MKRRNVLLFTLPLLAMLFLPACSSSSEDEEEELPGTIIPQVACASETAAFFQTEWPVYCISPRSPIYIPSASIDDYTVYFSDHPDYVLQLVDPDDATVVYYQTSLPSIYSGDYIIQIRYRI